ncbi:MAG TPA: hypothetical protein VFR33_05620 [Candidatus Dormibacteraeota bacterium]|nr:hypothetical protein [Candidatus Dormibacteraeota bacterium]
MRNSRRVVYCLAAGALAFLFAAPVSASTPAASAGTGTVAFIPNGPPRFADGNIIVRATLSGTVTGRLSGTWTEQAIEVIHADGSATTHAAGTFSVTTPCGAGSFPFELEAQQDSPTSNLSGRFRSIDDSAATVAIHTVDAFSTAPNSGVFTYVGTYSC